MLLEDVGHRSLGRQPAPGQPAAERHLPAELHGRCLNCLSYSHRVGTYRLPRRCIRCHRFRHLAKDCKRPKVENMTAGGRGSDGHFVRARRRHRRWRRRYRSWSRVNTTDPTDSSVHTAADCGEPANYTDSYDVATVDRSELSSGARLLGHDSSTLTMGPHNLLPGRDIMDDPMLEEFVASLTASRITTCPTLDHLASTPTAT